MKFFPRTAFGQCLTQQEESDQTGGSAVPQEHQLWSRYTAPERQRGLQRAHSTQFWSRCTAPEGQRGPQRVHSTSSGQDAQPQRDSMSSRGLTAPCTAMGKWAPPESVASSWSGRGRHSCSYEHREIGNAQSNHTVTR